MSSCNLLIIARYFPACEKLLVTDDKTSKEGETKEASSDAALSEEEKVQKEIKKSLEAFGKLGAELGGDFGLDFQREFAKVLADGGKYLIFIYSMARIEPFSYYSILHFR